MSPPGRPKGESLSAQHGGSPASPPGHAKGELLIAQRPGGPSTPPGLENELPSEPGAGAARDAPHIAFVAGETSGDLLAALVLPELRARLPRAQCAGIAGDRMIAAGCEPWHHVGELSVRGYAEVLRHLPRLLALRRRLIRRIPLMLMPRPGLELKMRRSSSIWSVAIEVYRRLSGKNNNFPQNLTRNSRFYTMASIRTISVPVPMCS